MVTCSAPGGIYGERENSMLTGWLESLIASNRGDQQLSLLANRRLIAGIES